VRRCWFWLCPLIHSNEGDAPDTHETPFHRSCHQHAPVWKLYMRVATAFDKNLADLFNNDLDSLLIFVSSAIGNVENL
jgi:hypothetical protein